MMHNLEEKDMFFFLQLYNENLIFKFNNFIDNNFFVVQWP